MPSPDVRCLKRRRDARRAANGERFPVCGTPQSSANSSHQLTRFAAPTLAQGMTARAGRPVASSEMIELSDLLFPDPVSRHGKISWIKVASLVQSAAEQWRRALFRKYLASARAHPNLAIRTQLEEELEKPTNNNTANIVLLGAACIVPLRTFVFPMYSDHGYEIAHGVLKGTAMPGANPATMAVTGQFSLVPDLLPQCGVAELAGRAHFSPRA